MGILVVEDCLGPVVTSGDRSPNNTPVGDSKHQDMANNNDFTDYEDDEFRPLVIDTSESQGFAVAMETDSEYSSINGGSNDLKVGGAAISSPITPKTVKNSNSKSETLTNGSSKKSPFAKHMNMSSNSVGSLKDYLECSGIDMPGQGTSGPSSISSGSSSQDTRNTGNTSQAGSEVAAPHSSKGSAPSKTRRKSDRILPVPQTDGQGSQFICPVCQSTMSNLTEFTKHIRSHNAPGNMASSPNACKICGKVLSSQSSLDRHMLVHSGERPFQCNVCQMSFTTNGNMHRHMRIHQKDGTDQKDSSAQKESTKDVNSIPTLSAAVKTHQTQQQRKKTSSNSEPKSENGKLKLKGSSSSLPVAEHPGKVASSPVTQPTLTLKRHLPEGPCTEPEEEATPAKRVLSVGENMVRDASYTSPERTSSDGEGSSSSSLVPYVKLLDKAASRLEANGDKLQCPLCDKSFLCPYGLDTHMDTHGTHAGKVPRCHACNLTFSNAKGLHLHNLEAHMQARGKDENVMMKSGDAANVEVGFHDLEFMSFSSEKFPVVAKAWCEKNQRKTSSAYHNYTCRRCDHAFPCGSSLKLHREAHAPEFPATCMQCDVSFGTRSEFKNHMTLHNQDKVISSYVNMEGTDDNPIQEAMSKEEFLLVLDLKVNKDKSRRSRSFQLLENEEREDLQDNTEYFAHLGMVKPASPTPGTLDRSPVRDLMRYDLKHPSRSNESQTNSSHNDFAEVTKILKMTSSSLDKMSPLQPATKSPKVNPKVTNNGLFTPRRGVLPKTPLLTSPFDHHSADPKPQNSETDDKLVLDLDNEDEAMMSPPPTKRGSQDKGAESPKEDREGPFTCKYCDEVFTNYRNYKGHVRGHLGLSPYKCNNCSYSSADKSTLIRHLRTHNGERPFQCLVCDFAFTTKANCERHVKKKHGRTSKEEIESSIGYNHFLNEQKVDEDAFASPDTVCKYCGEDFKFFRALKHHLRSHSSCRHKPYMCKLCSNGFSTKANCVRHVQKQHPHIEQNQLEKHIKVNEFLLEKYGEGAADIKEDPEESCSSGAPELGMLDRMYQRMEGVSSHGRGVNVGVNGDRKNSHAALRAHLEARRIPPNVFNMKNPFISTSPMYRDAPRNSSDISSNDQPLDFSMKPQQTVARQPDIKPPISVPNVMNGHVDEQPMDLSVKKAAASMVPMATAPYPQFLTVPKYNSSSLTGASTGPQQSILPSPSGGSMKVVTMATNTHNAQASSGVSKQQAANSAPMRLPLLITPPAAGAGLQGNQSSRPSHLWRAGSDFGMLRYKKEYQKFYNPIAGKLQCPYCKLFFKQGLKLLLHIRTHTQGSAADRQPYRCDRCPAYFNNKPLLHAHIRAKHSIQFMQHTQIQPNKIETMETSDNDIIIMGTKQNNSNIANTNSTNIPNLPMKSPVNNSSFSFDSELASVNKILNTTDATNFRSFFAERRNPEVAPPLPNFGAINSRDENMMENGNFRILPMIQTADSRPAQSPSPSPSLDGSTGRDYEDGVPKRKRNSYSDSPHKLQCPYCPRTFPWISSLKRHILTHTGQKPFKCPECPVTFSTKSNRERHMVRKHGVDLHDPATRLMLERPYRCHLCVYSTFATPVSLTKHYEDKHPGEIIPESALGQTTVGDNEPSTEEVMAALDKLDKQEVLMQGMGSGGNGSFGFEVQGVQLVAGSSGGDMAEDYEEDEEEYLDEEPKDTQTDAPFELKGQGHGSRSVSPAGILASRSTTPSIRAISPRSLSPGSSRGPSPAFSASPRSKDHSRSSSRSRSVTPTPRSRSTTPVPRNVTPVPSLPKSRSSTPASISTPESTPDKQVNPEKDNYNVDKILTCWKCNLTLDSRKNLLKHLKEHNVDLQYKCYMCDAMFETRMESLQHKQTVHTADWEQIVEKNKIMVVEDFVQQLDEIVDKTLKAEAAKGGGDEDYTSRKCSCSLCPKRFWSLQDLRRHMRSHTGERPFVCDICQARFTLKHSMMRHRKKHLDNASASEDDNSNMAADSEVEQVNNTAHRNLLSSFQEVSTVPTPTGSDEASNGPSEGVAFSSYQTSAQKVITKTKGPISILKRNLIQNGNKKTTNQSADILQNLLGMGDDEIDNMLSSAANRMGDCD